MKRHLNIGGLVAAGFDTSGEYLLAVSHSGRGVFSTQTWERVSRDNEISYPENGVAIGIGPIEGQPIAVAEIDHQTGKLDLISRDQRFSLGYNEGMIEVVIGEAPSTSDLKSPDAHSDIDG